jgi:uncharacterized protein YqgV (UPF0045/DUF77 family)
MKVTAELSFYALQDDYKTPVDFFLEKLKGHAFSVEPGTMSTLLTGEYVDIMKTLVPLMEVVFEKYHAIVQVKFSNSCLPD